MAKSNAVRACYTAGKKKGYQRATLFFSPDFFYLNPHRPQNFATAESHTRQTSCGLPQNTGAYAPINSYGLDRCPTERDLLDAVSRCAPKVTFFSRLGSLFFYGGGEGGADE